MNKKFIYIIIITILMLVPITVFARAGECSSSGGSESGGGGSSSSSSNGLSSSTSNYISLFICILMVK